MPMPLRRRAVLRAGAGLSGLALAGGAGRAFFAPATVAAEGFTMNGFAVEEPFATYWREHGGLAQQGLPISNRFPEKSTINGQTYSVQYFERAVFELHPEYAGSENEVLLQLLGREQYLARYPNGAPGQEPNTSPGSVLFEETGKRLGGPFLAYWEANGGLRQQGLPLTDEFLEVSPTNGQTYRVQYFERARFEWHPENEPPYDVLLGLLGSDQFLARYPNGQPGGNTPPPPPPANVLYAADWSGGLGGWAGGGDWRVEGGLLTNDGASGSDPSFILAPAQTPLAGYAVEAEIQVLNPESATAGAGILVRREQDDASGYMGGWAHDEEGTSVAVISTPGMLFHSGPELAKPFAPGGGWHAYRLEVRGSAIRLLIDGAPTLTYSNDRYISGTTTSLWSRGARINVRAFRIVGL
jgi:hypothetical protein